MQRWPKHWSFSFSPSSEYSWLISFRIDWFDLLVVQGTLNSLLQYHNLKASIVQYATYFIVQLSHLYMTTEKDIALTICTFGSKKMSLFFNTLSRFVTAFLPRSKHLISWLQSPSTGILKPKKRKFDTTSAFPPSICHEIMGPDAVILFVNVEFQASLFTLLFHLHQKAL